MDAIASPDATVAHAEKSERDKVIAVGNKAIWLNPEDTET